MGAILKELHNSASKFQFPSMPKDDVDVKRETAYQEYNILGKGKMSYPSGMGTQIIKWSGYFWGAGRKKLASVNQKWIAPKTCASKLKSWQTKKTPLNLVVSEAGINEDVTIKSFEYKPFGGHGDYSYEISFPIYQEVLNYNGRSNGMIKILLSKKLGEMRLTQADLARATGIRPNTINELYHELADRVNLEHLDLICEALDCELDELIVRVPNKESAITHTRQGTQKPGRKR